MIWLSSFFSSTTVLPLLEALSFCWMGKCSIEHIQECSDTCSIQFPRWLGFWTDGANEWWEVSCSEVYSVDPIAFGRWRNWFGRVEGLISLTSRLPEVQSWNQGWDLTSERTAWDTMLRARQPSYREGERKTDSASAWTVSVRIFQLGKGPQMYRPGGRKILFVLKNWK